MPDEDAEWKKIPMKPHEFYVECPCCLEDYIIDRVDDHADTYIPDEVHRFIKCDCGQNLEALAVEVIQIRADLAQPPEFTERDNSGQKEQKTPEISRTGKPPAGDVEEDLMEAQLFVDQISFTLDKDAWSDEFKDWYEPDKWFNARRAASSFIAEKVRGLIGQDLAAVREKIEGLRHNKEALENEIDSEGSFNRMYGHNQALDAVLALLKQGG